MAPQSGAPGLVNDLSCGQHIIGDSVRFDRSPGMTVGAEGVLDPAGADEDAAAAGSGAGRDVRRVAIANHPTGGEIKAVVPRRLL